jgi:hypothetical protein
MDEDYWTEDTAELEKTRTTLQNLETALGPGKTVTYEASAAVDEVTKKLLLRAWQDHQGQPDQNKEKVRELLSRAQTLRRNISMFPSDKYNEEYQSWLQSWRGGR